MAKPKHYPPRYLEMIEGSSHLDMELRTLGGRGRRQRSSGLPRR